MENIECSEMLRTMGFRGDIVGFVIDEAHCITQWGGDFRPVYSKLHGLRTLAPPGTPIGALSATLTPKIWSGVESTLLINPRRAFYLNRGNNRPNIKMSMKVIKNMQDYDALVEELRLQDIRCSEDIPKTVVFAESRIEAQQIWRHLRNRLREDLRASVAFAHALRSEAAKENALERFRRGELRILVATECLAMVRSCCVTELNK